jgi:hypothetical protein
MEDWQPDRAATEWRTDQNQTDFAEIKSRLSGPWQFIGKAPVRPT